MKTILAFVVGLVVGVTITGAVGRFVIYPAVAREKEEFGRNQGYVDARVEIAHKIRDTLGDDHQRGEPATNFYSVKDVDVLVVNRNDVKTLRLYRDR